MTSRSDSLPTEKPVATFSGKDEAGASEQSLNELRHGLARPLPTTRGELEEDLRRLFPLIVPSEYFKLKMPAQHDPLPDKDLALTWVLLQPTTMLYLTPEEAARFEEEGFGWRARGIENLAYAQGGMATHEKRNRAGQLLWVSMMQEDGLGSSRVLLAPNWRKTFPEGYWVALPDRSCGMVVSKAPSPTELAEVKTMVSKMYEGATTPMSDRLYEPEELAIPADWFPTRPNHPTSHLDG